jgi:hypothetical protein
LRDILPQEGVALAWVSTVQDRDAALDVHESPSLLVVVRGNADLVTDTRRHIEAGDVVTIPPAEVCRFTGAGKDGLLAVEVVLPAPDQTSADGVPSRRRLLDRNEVRARKAMSGSLFRLLQGRELGAGAIDQVAAQGEHALSGALHAVLCLQCGTCPDEFYSLAFERNLRQHLLRREATPASSRPEAPDPIVAATASWFPAQVLALDNAATVVLQLVLETATDVFRALVSAALALDSDRPTGTRSAAGAAGSSSGLSELLEGHHPNTYLRLEGVLDDAWNMLDTLMTRLGDLGREHPNAPST